MNTASRIRQFETPYHVAKASPGIWSVKNASHGVYGFFDHSTMRVVVG